MKKKILITIAGLFVLLVLSIVLLPVLFKDKIIALVKDEANKNLNAKMDFGTFDLSLLKSFPDFSFVLNDFSLVGINEFEKDTLTAIKKLEFTIDIMSVIKGDQIKIKSFLLDEPYIKAIVLEDGKANWDIAKQDTNVSQPEVSSEPSKFKANLKKYEIRNGQIIYDDRAGKMYAEMAGFNHTGSGDFTQDLFLLQTNTYIDALTYKDAGVPYLNKVNTKFKADIDMDMPNFKFTFKENEIQLNQLFLGFDGWLSMPNDDIDMDITYLAKKTEFKNILSLIPAVYSKEFESVKTAGKLALDGYVKGKYNDNSMPGFGLKLLVENAMFQYPDLPKAVNNIHVNLLVDNKTGIPDHTVIDLKRFYMEMAENPFEMKMHITTPESDANIKGEIKGKINMGSVKDIVPLEDGESMNGMLIADLILDGKMSSIEKEQYDQFNFSGQVSVLDMLYKSKEMAYDLNISKLYLNFSPKFVELSALEAKIGKSDLSAKGRLDNFLQFALKDDTLTGAFTMSSNLMDLNEFMTEESESVPVETVSTEASPMSIIEVPGNINFSLVTSITKMLYDNMTMENVSGSVKIAERKVAMQNLKMNLLDGSMMVNGSYETKDLKSPAVDFALEIAGFDIQKTNKTFNTVETLAPVAKNCFGKFSTSMSFSARLDEKMEPILNSLNGKGGLKTAGVIIQNFEPINKLADAVKMEKYKKMELKDVNLSFEFKDGRVQISPFDVKIGNSSANISGSTGFDKTIDYTWKLEVPSSEFGGAANAAAASVLAQLNAKAGTGIALPEKIKMNVLLGGTVTNPTVKVSLKEGEGTSSVADGLKDKAKEEFDKKKAELEAKAREEADRLKKEAEDKLKAEGDKIKAEADKIKREAEEKARAEADRLKAEAEKKKKEAEEKAKEEAKKQLKNMLKP